jgi:signal transduction histidine kinase/CheY-like chemotaxis protein
MSPAPVKILHVEDIRSDADLVKRGMRTSQLSYQWLWVTNKKDFEAALVHYVPNIILCDHSLPDFTSIEALSLLKLSGLDIPFILITATISEEFAVMMMQQGIADYLLKDRIQRLPTAVDNALEKWQSRKEKEAYLAEIVSNEKKFRGLIENSNDLILLLNANLNLIYASPNCSRITGWTPGEMMQAGTRAYVNGEDRSPGEDEREQSGASFYDTIHPEDVALMKGLFQQAKENPGEAVHCIGRIRHKKGAYIWIEGIIRNMLSNESVRGIIFNYRDISERMEADLQREKMTLDITQRNRDLEQFTYIVSHNLRAPVANILGISNLLDIADLEEGHKREALMGITSSARRLDEVISDLNAILQEKQKITENKQIVYFQVLVDDVHSSLENIIKGENISIKTDFEDAESIATIKSYLYSIFYNLIANSIKYRRVDIPLLVEVRSARKKNKIRLSFKDNGLGINLKTQGDKVFGLYKRFHPGTEGKGMGLFMVKTQVETLGGSISVESEINEGTEFTIIL